MQASASPLKQRVVGAIVLISLAVIFLPMLLEREGPARGIHGSNIPSNAENTLDAIEFQLDAASPPAESGSILPPKTSDIPFLQDILDKLKTGVATEKPMPAHVTKPQEQAYTWMVQLATFSNEPNAITLRDQLRGKGFATFVDKVSGKEGEMWRIRVGPELTPERAQELSVRLEKETGLQPLVVRVP